MYTDVHGRCVRDIRGIGVRGDDVSALARGFCVSVVCAEALWGARVWMGWDAAGGAGDCLWVSCAGGVLVVGWAVEGEECFCCWVGCCVPAASETEMSDEKVM